jgi:hypothetical protein
VRPQISRVVCDMATRAKGRRGPARPKAPKAPMVPEAPEAPAPPAPPDVPAAGVAPSGQHLVALRLAAAAQMIEAAGLGVAAVFAAISTADGKSHQVAAGVALTLLAVVAAAGVALIAAALAKARPWSRTPTVMIQLLVVIGGITLLDGQRPEWGVPALLLAAACLAGLLTPASLRALNRPSVRSQ